MLELVLVVLVDVDVVEVEVLVVEVLVEVVDVDVLVLVEVVVEDDVNSPYTTPRQLAPSQRILALDVVKKYSSPGSGLEGKADTRSSPPLRLANRVIYRLYLLKL